MSVIRKRSLLAKHYEQNAKDCIREAEGTDDPQWRKQLLNWAREWVEAAVREASRLRVPKWSGSTGRSLTVGGRPAR
jgi:hypothetical protein